MKHHNHHHGHPKPPKALFICKQSEAESDTFYGYFRKYSGLFISARLVSRMLEKELGVESDVVVAKDNNEIDRLVTQAKPTHVFIEAYWVVPEKFEILAKLHPNVKWIIRVHSETPFLSLEGMSMEWTLKYLDYKNVYIAPNSTRVFEDLKIVLRQKYSEKVVDERVIYLPNYYEASCDGGNYKVSGKKWIDIGCFGAVRPLKNHLIQAIAAIKFADKLGMKMKFHINSNRVEGNGQPILRNLRSLFEGIKKHELVEHAWMPHPEFKRLIKTMEIGMQCSFTETFNIVTADFVTENIPVVTSPEVFWLPPHIYANPTDTNDMVRKLNRVWTGRLFNLQSQNLDGLKCYSNDSMDTWDKYLVPNRYC